MQVLWGPSQLLHTFDVTFRGDLSRRSCNRSPTIQSHIPCPLWLEFLLNHLSSCLDSFVIIIQSFAAARFLASWEEMLDCWSQRVSADQKYIKIFRQVNAVPVRVGVGGAQGKTAERDGAHIPVKNTACGRCC